MTRHLEIASNRRALQSLFLGASACAALAVTGCAKPFAMRAVEQNLQVRLDPATGELAARSLMRLEALDDGPLPEGSVWVGIDLHPDLNIDNVEISGATLSRSAVDREAGQGDHRLRFLRHKLFLEVAPRRMDVKVSYRGALKQDISEGEKTGQIHNFGVSAHVSEEGTYLSPGGAWYPTPAMDDESVDPDVYLTDWRLEVEKPADYALVASGREVESDGSRTVWESPRPMSGITLTGGYHDVWTRKVSGVGTGEVDIRVHMKRGKDESAREENEAVAERYLAQAENYIRRYEPLLGPFPFSQYTIVENFFSSGFAFPAMTLFGPVVMHMGDNSFRHGYLDHELVHSWWGCGVEVDPRDGNWCESLTSYCTNYYGYILDNDFEGARKKRRDHSNFLSRIKEQDDKPLGTYGLEGGVGRGIAYSKGAAVFEMLARHVGQEAFWRGCRDVTLKHMGRHVDWSDLKAAFEEASGLELDGFFEQWVRGSGAPKLRLLKLRYDPVGREALALVSQGTPVFDLRVPLRLSVNGEVEDRVVTLTREEQWVALDAVSAPDWVALDPDYMVFRKLAAEEIMPTTAATRAAAHLTIVVPPGALADGYETVAKEYRKGREESGKRTVATVTADDGLSPETLREGGVLVLGDAVRHPVVEALLARAGSVASWHASGFAVGDEQFDNAEHAILMTVHHPDGPENGLTVYMGNSEAALKNAGILGFYANSLLVFDSSGDRSEVVLRRDLESTQRLTLE